jgi:hypothetical protein
MITLFKTYHNLITKINDFFGISKDIMKKKDNFFEKK